jgi:hypothetical protein
MICHPPDFFCRIHAMRWWMRRGACRPFLLCAAAETTLLVMGGASAEHIVALGRGRHSPCLSPQGSGDMSDEGFATQGLLCEAWTIGAAPYLGGAANCGSPKRAMCERIALQETSYAYLCLFFGTVCHWPRKPSCIGEGRVGSCDAAW